MKPNTSHDEHKNEELSNQGTANYFYGQGYAKALADVEKITKDFKEKIGKHEQDALKSGELLDKPDNQPTTLANHFWGLGMLVLEIETKIAKLKDKI